MSKFGDTIQSLYRQEFSRMVAVICSLYGLEHMELAEDIVSETFLVASEDWEKKGLPPNPAAWLYTVAKQKTLYHFRRKKIFAEKVLPALQASAEDGSPEFDFSSQGIKDSQLQMMFAVCHPAIASEAQMGLALRTLCGFSIEEIALAFLCGKDTINKRLFRARERLRSEGISLSMPSGPGIEKRLDNVLHIIYLLFSEGYYSASGDHILRKELCAEAIRLAVLLTEYELTDQPRTNALLALMCFHASRFDARQDERSDFILYEHQDKSRWDMDLVARGNYFLERSAKGEELSSYHLEAGIAFWHCRRQESKEKWENILYHYELLLKINYSPVVALNRIYALYRVRGREEALREALELDLNDHFYMTLLGELYSGLDDKKARDCFARALGMANKPAEKKIIRAKLESLESAT